jgi:hypothetical protein
VIGNVGRSRHRSKGRAHPHKMSRAPGSVGCSQLKSPPVFLNAWSQASPQ